MKKKKKVEPRFFNRSFVAKEVGVKPTTIQHWEREITYIDKRIKRSSKERKRLYSRENIEQFLEVKRLVEEERLSIEEVDTYFKNGFHKAKEKETIKSDLEKKTEAQIILKGVIIKLEELKKLL